MKNIGRLSLIVLLIISLVTMNAVQALAVSGTVSDFDKNREYIESVYTIDTEFDGIKKTENNEYAAIVSDGDLDVALPVGRIDADILNEKSFEELMSVLTAEDVSNKLVEDIKAKHDQMMENGVSTCNISIFSPEFLASNTREVKYYTYKGTQMKSEFVYYTGCDTMYQTVASGSAAVTVAMSLVSIGFGYAGNISKVLPLVGSGISLYQMFESVYGSTWATGSTSDKVQINVNYNNTVQYTSANVGGSWYTGLVTQKVTSNYVKSLQFYWNREANSGKTLTKDNYHTINDKSPHYDNPWAEAYQNMYVGETEWLSWKAGGRTFSF